MTKSEKHMLAKLAATVARGFVNADDPMIGICARTYSALIRSTMTLKSRNEMICIAGGVPAIVFHPDFIV